MSIKEIESLSIDYADADYEFEMPQSFAQMDPLEKMEMLSYWIKQFYFEYRKVIGEYFINSFNNNDEAKLPLHFRVELFQIIAEKNFPHPIPNDLRKICTEAFNASKAKK